MNVKSSLQFLIGIILSGGLFVVSVYLTDITNNRLTIYIGIGIIALFGFLIKRKKIKPLTIGYWIGFIPIIILILGFLVISSLH